MSGFSSDIFPRIELDLPHALDYLHGDVLRLDCDRKGYLLVCYRGVPLGFVKNLGSRANNLYPQDWRIRMSVR